MKKIVSTFVILVLSTIICLGQERLEAFDGTAFKLNDTITIGIPSENEYESIYENYSLGYMRKLDKNIFGNRFVVKTITKEKIYSGYEPEVLVISRIKDNKLKLYMVPDKAIKTGEIVLIPYKNEDSVEILSDSIAFFYLVKNSKKLVTNFREEFLYRFMNAKYNESKNDEFQRNKYLKEAEDILNKGIASISYSKVYKSSGIMELGSYDFNLNQFTFNQSSCILKKADKVSDMDFTLGKIIQYPQIDIKMLNFEDYKHFKLHPELANNLLKRRKSDIGIVDRNVYVIIYYYLLPNLVQLKQDDNLYEENKHLIMQGMIKKIDVLDNRSFEYNYWGTIKK